MPQSRTTYGPSLDERTRFLTDWVGRRWEDLPAGLTCDGFYPFVDDYEIVCNVRVKGDDMTGLSIYTNDNGAEYISTAIPALKEHDVIEVLSAFMHHNRLIRAGTKGTIISVHPTIYTVEFPDNLIIDVAHKLVMKP